MGKGGSTNSVEYPAWLEDAARRNLDQADRISRIGSVPMSYGPTVAAFTPMQNSSFLNTANAASAFGLDAPTGTAVTGGLNAPTTYANGVTAYSALPIYNETMDEFRLDRPGQASYIDSFFIDPFTGQPGSNVASVASTPTSTVSSGGSGDTDYSPGTDAFYNPGNRTNFAANATDDYTLNYGEDDQGNVYSVGYGANSISPAKADEIGLTIRNDNPFDYTIGDHFSAMATDVSEMPGKIKDDIDEATVMCTAYYEMGMLPKEIWNLDRRYGVKVFRNDPLLLEGYHLWGIPTANYIRKKTFFANIARKIMWPIVKAWAEEMAHCMKPAKYKANYFGKVIKFVGEPFSRLVGKIYKYQIRLSGRKAEA